MALIRKIYLLLAFFALLFTSCDGFGELFGGGPDDDDSDGDEFVLPNIKPFRKGETVSRTLLVYIMAENDISDCLTKDFFEIKEGAYALPDDVRLFVYFDNSDAERMPALYQFHPYEGRLVENVVYAFEEDVCSSDTTILGQVLDVIFDDYPTNEFDLIMGSHAGGWVTHQAKSSASRWIGADNEENSYLDKPFDTTIEIKELVDLFDRLPVKIDRLMFDACLMQGVEVAYALRNVADWIIASPAEILADGAPYDKMIPEFFNPSSGIEDIMYEYKKAYDNTDYAALLSAVQTSYMQNFAEVTRRYVEEYFSADYSNATYSGCLAYVPGKAPAYYDINSVMKKNLDEIDYKEWKAAFDEVVPYIMISNSRLLWSNIAYKAVPVDDSCGGLSAYFPRNMQQNAACNKDFKATEWYSAAGWDVAGW